MQKPEQLAELVKQQEILEEEAKVLEQQLQKEQQQEQQLVNQIDDIKVNIENQAMERFEKNFSSSVNKLLPEELPEELSEMIERSSYIAKEAIRREVDQIDDVASGTEIPFQLQLTHPTTGKQLLLRGQFDRIDVTPSGVIITEKKVSLATTSITQNLQLQIYALAYWRSHNIIPIKIQLEAIKGTNSFGYTPTQKELEMTEQFIWNQVAEIEKGQFIASPSATLCEKCHYAMMCPAASRIRLASRVHPYEVLMSQLQTALELVNQEQQTLNNIQHQNQLISPHNQHPQLPNPNIKTKHPKKQEQNTKKNNNTTQQQSQPQPTQPTQQPQQDSNKEDTNAKITYLHSVFDAIPDHAKPKTHFHNNKRKYH